jgi:lipopolysaccharide transport system ATP-binding protein
MSGQLQVLNLGKSYRQWGGELRRIASWFIPSVLPREEHWALKGISFSISPGEAVGIIGQNGAGKSTLLKLITGTTQASEGEVKIHGRVSAILELGMGFNPDLTGRENAYHSAGLMGNSQVDIERSMPDIESFAQVGEYFDQPVRTYSSGMLARVAFAVATAFKPDILIVDEALSVGDMAFQAKCIQRMSSFIDAGVAVLFVSHSLAQIRQFCTKAVFLESGRMVEYGDAAKVCDRYQNSIAERGQILAIETTEVQFNSSESLRFEEDPNLRLNSVLENTGSMELAFTSFEMFNKNMLPISACMSHEQVLFKASIRANSQIPVGSAVGLSISDSNGYHLFSCNSDWYDKYLPSMSKGDTTVITWQLTLPFLTGEFRVDVGLKPKPLEAKFYDRVFCAKTFQVHRTADLFNKNIGGLLYVEANISVTTN